MNSVRAILLLESNTAMSGVIVPVPAVLMDVLGRSTLQRTIDSLSHSGVTDITVLAESNSASPAVRNLTVEKANIVRTEAASLWRTAESLFETQAEAAANVFLIRINAYMELNWNAIVQHHERHLNRVTRVWHGTEPQPLDVFLVSSSRRNDAAFLLRGGLRASRTDCKPYEVGQNNEDEYINLLEHEFDIRRLASDALHCTCNLRPEGKEIRPGIWVAAGARIDKKARLVAPAYVGRRARICPGAVITRGSAVEHHAVVGHGTVIENATVLPYSELGPGLEVSHAIVGNKHLFHLQKNLCIAISDSRLVGVVSDKAGLRVLGSTASLLSFIPRQVWRGLTGHVPESEPAVNSTIDYVKSFNPPEKESAQMSAGLAVMRRYGNQ
ncbi:MAG: putative mannose-phosphate guanyltransferase [Acidobacteriales bacterium]|nr:putative mannose-phosphate guanyltransferase [Terriglobales bacterium]